MSRVNIPHRHLADGNLTEKQYYSELIRIRKLAKLLDRQVKLPGGIYIGLDGIIGLIPVVGDIIGGGLSTFLIVKAYQLKLPRRKLAKMVMHTGVDSALGAVPIVGDLFDIGYKANVKNAQIIERHLTKLLEARTEYK